MRFRLGLGGLSLRSKILLMILPVSLTSMGLAVWVGYSTAQSALTRQADETVTAIRASKKAQLEAYFREIRGTFAAFSNDIGIAAAAQGFTEGFNQLGRQKPVSSKPRRWQPSIATISSRSWPRCRASRTSPLNS